MRKWICTAEEQLEINTVYVGNEPFDYEAQMEAKPGILLSVLSWFVWQSIDDQYYSKASEIKLIENGVIRKKFVENLTDREYELLFNFYLKQTSKH